MTTYLLTIITHTDKAPYRMRVWCTKIDASSPLQAVNAISIQPRFQTLSGLDGHTVHWFSDESGRMISVEEARS